ncbi:hypothetical protein B0H17DRAFT_1130967 [Mycena rosella]|uniref:Uncharacterized protein n=1 Tax=Mycena rosella TaxID=1033263 RepID=A0AAD7DPG8_MYCRO|nr:hypothetical protein B0H17DRAFT_1130967 [Mycena rosella]
MILTDNDKALDPATTPVDAPPSYEASSGSYPAPAPAPFPNDVKRPPPSPASPVASGSSLASSSSSSALKSPPVTPSWFNFASPTVRQVRATVLGLVRDLVKLPPSDQSAVAISILKSCADACAANGLSISTILQEKSVEDHTPLYWAIVKRPAELPEQQAGTDLLTTLLSLSTPLTPATTSDIRLACLLTSDQALFQRLRNSPEFAPLSATDEMLLDATMPPDDITVKNVGGEAGQEGAFVVDFAIVRFQKRMLVSKCIVLDFIARARMWRLSFNVSPHERRRPHLPPPGTWYASLSLLENSPPTWLDSRLLVPAPPESATEPSGSGFASGLFGPGKPRPRPTLSVRMKATEQLRAPGRGPGHRNCVIVLLDGAEGDVGLGGLQYAGSPYIAADETLRGRLEARLAKPEADCVIC